MNVFLLGGFLAPLWIVPGGLMFFAGIGWLLGAS